MKTCRCKGRLGAWTAIAIGVLTALAVSSRASEQADEAEKEDAPVHGEP